MKIRIVKYLKWALGVALAMTFIIGLVFLNQYLKSEKLLFYKTGSKEKAILNSTWNMSYKEIERANNVKLQKGLTFVFFEDELNKLLDPNRISAKTHKSMNLWSFDSELTYEFFDDRLFRYRLTGELYDLAKFDSIATKNLEKRYGKIRKSPNELGGAFLKDSVFVEYRQFDIENDDKSVEHRFLIEVTYQPLFNQIVKTANKDQHSIF